MEESVHERGTFALPPQPERELRDSAGARWTVREVRPFGGGPSAGAADAGLRPRLGYEDGWLTFTSVRRDESYRIAPFPRDWRELSDFALERWLARAKFEAARRAEQRVERRGRS